MANATFFGGDQRPPPRTREVHNGRLVRAGREFGVPSSWICPDCYKPPSMCDHLSDPDLRPLWGRPKR